MLPASWTRYLRDILNVLLRIRHCKLIHGATDQDPGLRLPALHIQEPVRMANPTVVRPTKSCMICLDAYVGDEVESMFPHSCAICTAGNYCSKCLKDWFLDACKNESKMPPKCCTAIPLSTMVGHLDAAQVSSRYPSKPQILTSYRSSFSRLSLKSGVQQREYTAQYPPALPSSHHAYMLSQ
jgi:hypothetical protein